MDGQDGQPATGVGRLRSSIDSVTGGPSRFGRRVARHPRLLAGAASVGVACLIGILSFSSNGTTHGPAQSERIPIGQAELAASLAPAATAAPAGAIAGNDSLGSNRTAAGSLQVVVSSIENSQIIKTGSIALEVQSLDASLAQAQAKIVGMGGYVAQSSRSGTGSGAAASVTYRLPAARWDDALGAMRGLGTKVLSEQTGTSDVTAQVVDLDARLTNLQATEKALQAIMVKATAIPDILAVQQQLTAVRGDIEELTAQRDHLKDQAAMSTLAVSFQLPGAPVITAATTGWDAGAQVDEAIATLVHLGQGLATVGIWIALVGLPVGLGLLFVLLIAWLLVRRFGVSRRRMDVAAPASPDA